MIDLRKIIDPATAIASGFRYRGVGRNGGPVAPRAESGGEIGPLTADKAAAAAF
ncbi:hypothetical protein [Rhizobium sp. C1]|uniref:hypothetical protein n=1 Tax=Rhizobium sp. C1 TaxID=1349799 RepID=UPI001E401741|nr:hypothetical protein [Rhizobium sp. C1]MCD2178137.1 hypothetical protein [Rhizobium sp. C1]